jgi:AcrR family transcriptional regulator
MTETIKRSAGIKTREAILGAAKHLFLRQGYHATGMREIAHEAGISLGATYNHFTSKEEILKELLGQHNLYGAMAEGLRRARGETVSELLQSGFTEIMASLQGKFDFPLFLFMDILEFQGRHVGELVNEAFPTLFAFFQRVHRVGCESGEMRDVSVVLLGRTFIGMVFSSFIIDIMGVVTAGNIKVPLQMQNWQEGMTDILLHGMLKALPDQEGGQVDVSQSTR